MAWTYNEAQTADRDILRFRIGDTNTNKQLLSDGELDAILGRKTGVIPAALEAVDAILAQVARDIDRNAAGVSATRSQMFEHYTTLRGTLQDEMRTEAEAFTGGLSRDDKDSFENDTDFVAPSFDREMDDMDVRRPDRNPGWDQ